MKFIIFLLLIFMLNTLAMKNSTSHMYFTHIYHIISYIKSYNSIPVI